MDNEIKPVAQSPTPESSPTSDKRSSRGESPEPAKDNVDVKIQAVAHEREVSQDSSSINSGPLKYESGYGAGDIERHERHDEVDWEPGFQAQFPWIGFAGLLTVIVATGLAIVILVTSNKRRVDVWPFASFPTQPNVLLNITNSLQNLGLLTMIGQGLAIAWWRKAMKGSSLNTLHSNHAYSNSVYAIVTSGRHFNLIALAALMTKFAVIDSTLFQRATKAHIMQSSRYMNSSVTAWIEKDWHPMTGGIPGDEGNIKTVTTAWAGVIDAYNGKIANNKMHDSLADLSSFFGCGYRQECTGAMEGIGVSFNCSTQTESVDYGLARLGQQSGVRTSYPLWNINFEPSWATDSKPYASIKLDMLYVDSHAGVNSSSCPGTLTRQTCDIRPALVEYPITVMTPSKEELAGRNIVTHIKFFDDLDEWPLGTSLNEVTQIDELRILKNTDLIEHFNETSTVGALAYVLQNLHGSSANLSFTTAWDLQTNGASAQATFFNTNEKDADTCWYNIKKTGKDDPAVEMLRKVNTMSFVAGLYLNGAPSHNVSDRAALGMSSQTVSTIVSGVVEEYITSYAYMGGALAATLMTVLLVLPVYWGFWQLGRKVTLGPLEISNAFGAPILSPEQAKHYHGDFEQVLGDVGKRRVKYGQLKDGAVGQMGIAEPARVLNPKRTSRNESSRSAVKGIGMGAVVGGVVAAAVGSNVKSS